MGRRPPRARVRRDDCRSVVLRRRRGGVRRGLRARAARRPPRGQDLASGTAAARSLRDLLFIDRPRARGPDVATVVLMICQGPGGGRVGAKRSLRSCGRWFSGPMSAPFACASGSPGASCDVGERPPDLHAEARSPGNAAIAQRPSRPGLRLQASPRPDNGTGISLARAVMMALAHASNPTSDAEPRPRNGTSNPIPADPARHAGPRVHEARPS